MTTVCLVVLNFFPIFSLPILLDNSIYVFKLFLFFIFSILCSFSSIFVYFLERALLYPGVLRKCATLRCIKICPNSFLTWGRTYRSIRKLRCIFNAWPPDSTKNASYFASFLFIFYEYKLDI